MRQKIKDIIKLLGVNLFLIIITLFTLEIIFRIYCTLSLYSKFPSFINDITNNSNKIKPKAIPDDKVGYRYKPYYSLEKETPFKVRFSTNKYGHPGKIDYPKKRQILFELL
jgi:hypothetical protein